MNKKGFTLVEVISVIALLGLIIGLAVPGVMRSSKKAKERTLNTKIKNIEKAAVMYGQDNRGKFSIDNTSCSLCEKMFETDGTTCNGTKYSGKCYISNCNCFENPIKVSTLVDPNNDGNTKDGYITVDDESGNIINSTDESKNINNCEIQIYQKYGKIYAVYNKNNKDDSKCWID